MISKNKHSPAFMVKTYCLGEFSADLHEGNQRWDGNDSILTRILLFITPLYLAVFENTLDNSNLLRSYTCDDTNCYVA